MLSRILVITVLVMIVYFILKSKIIKPARPAPSIKDRTPPPDPGFKDVGDMAKDPVCGTYVEAGSALSLTDKGQSLYFCSRECMEKFRRKRRGEKA